jgi:cardiolipin synthase
MRRSLFVVVIAAALVALSWVLIAGAGAPPPTSHVAKIWTEPQAGYGFLDTAISDARRTVVVSMYEFSDPTMENDLIADAQRGVLVRVLLNAAYEGRSENAAAAKKLKAGAVNVSWAPSSQIFHAKYVVVDSTVAYIGTGNFQSYYYASTRDFWVEDTLARDVTAISATFSRDFSHQVASPTSSGGLVWSPGSTSTLVGLIGSAHHSLLVENEEMDNASIERALEAAASRGVHVKVVMTYSSDWASALKSLESSGVNVSTLDSSEVYVHAKVICADCTNASGTVFIGSENFSTASLSYNRELGVVTTTLSAVRAVAAAVNADYATGTVR